MSTAWQPLREDAASWLNRLPRARTVVDRRGWIAEFVRGRRVAHVGFGDIGCEVTNRTSRRWLHDHLARTAAELIGLDVSSAAVSAARAEGFAAHAVDCTDREAVAKLEIGRFDVVILGEIIEHVDNPGGLLAAAGELVAPDGMLVVTTPNARRLMDVLLAAVGREIIHPDHVAIYSLRTLVSLLERHGWRAVDAFTYLNRPTARPRTIKELVLRAAWLGQSILARTTSPYVADGLIVTAARTAR